MRFWLLPILAKIGVKIDTYRTEMLFDDFSLYAFLLQKKEVGLIEIKFWLMSYLNKLAGVIGL